MAELRVGIVILTGKWCTLVTERLHPIFNLKKLPAGKAGRSSLSYLSMRMASVLRSFSSQVSLSSAMIFSDSYGAQVIEAVSFWPLKSAVILIGFLQCWTKGKPECLEGLCQ